MDDRAGAERWRRNQRPPGRQGLRLADGQLRPRLPRGPHDTVDGGRFEQPIVYWVPSIAVTGMTIYTGDRFPAVETQRLRRRPARGRGAAQRPAATRGLQRRMGRDPARAAAAELKQRIRDVRQGPDGLLYVLTGETPGASGSNRDPEKGSGFVFFWPRSCKQPASSKRGEGLFLAALIRHGVTRAS